MRENEKGRGNRETGNFIKVRDRCCSVFFSRTDGPAKSWNERKEKKTWNMCHLSPSFTHHPPISLYSLQQ